jgi:hypothetical protein
MFHVEIEILPVKDHHKAGNEKINIIISKILGKVKDVFTFVSSEITVVSENYSTITAGKGTLSYSANIKTSNIKVLLRARKMILGLVQALHVQWVVVYHKKTMTGERMHILGSGLKPQGPWYSKSRRSQLHSGVLGFK